MLEKMTYLLYPGNHEQFFEQIEQIFPRPDERYYYIERAYQAAKDAFRPDVRETGERYFEHLRIVALILIHHLRIIDHELIAAALLHDIVEDKVEWPIERVTDEFGPRVGRLVAFLTNPSKTKYPDKEHREYIIRRRLVHAPRDFLFSKLADRLHNVFTLCGCSKEKQVRKIEETKRLYMSYAEREKILIHELEEGMERIVSEWGSAPVVELHQERGTA